MVTDEGFVKICGFSKTKKGEIYSSDRSETMPVKWAVPEAFRSGTCKRYKGEIGNIDR